MRLRGVNATVETDLERPAARPGRKGKTVNVHGFSSVTH
jgi:hypothetical protein